MIRYLCIITTFAVVASFSQSHPKNNAGVHVDTNGVLRWKGTNDEVSLFGVNYTTPFAYSYRAHKRLGLSLKKAIDLDVAQMSRLGFDAFRVHVWDREISDQDGNVIQNEHLELFDYLLSKLADHGIKTILTPIAWWGNGWPEPDETTSGFSQNYKRLELITNPKAREAQRNYLAQLLAHKNQYTKFSYKDDPSIIAIEIINEPTHPESEQVTTDYINDMARVLHSVGYTKPIFYNISQNWSDIQANAVIKASVDGVSFQWYPTDLVHNKMLTGNYLMNVNHYAIPSDNVVGFEKKAKIVYEFDAADAGASYMYPAMVRSFREVGMQFATMFSYDPVQIAWSNTEYPTHFVNLLYTPSKALSLMIAGKAFRQLPRMQSYGDYPENSQFGDFRVSYQDNLSEMNTDSEFIYSNSTVSIPKNAAAIQHIAGCGNSSLVQYDGMGAYFLDKLEPGIWRLEVYPDVLWLRDPFKATSMSRQVARLFWCERTMNLVMPDLGEDYVFHLLGGSKQHTEIGVHANTRIEPGIYLITAETVGAENIKKYLSKKETFLEGLYTPPAVSPGIYVVNKTSQYAVESNRVDFRFQIASEQKISDVILYIRRLGWRGFAKLALTHVGGFDYTVSDSSHMTQSGELEYCVAVEVGNNIFTFPEGVQNTPDKWDFSTSHLWIMKVIKRDKPIVLLDVCRNRKDFVFPHYSKSMRYVIDYGNGSNSEETALSLRVSFSDDEKIPFGFQLNVSEWVKPFTDHLENYQYVVLRARSNEDSMCTVGINLLMADGKNYGVNAKLKASWQDLEIPLSTFRNQKHGNLAQFLSFIFAEDMDNKKRCDT